MDNIDPIIYQAALELGYTTGADCRKTMLAAGMTEQEVDEVIHKAFAWLHERNDRLVLAEAKLREFDIKWDGNKYVFTPDRGGPY